MSNRIKRTNDELKADRPTLVENKSIPKLPISILVENVRSVHNVGSIFRSADGFGASKIYLTGYTAYPLRADLSKTALGSEKAVPWEHFESPIEAAKKILTEGISLVLLEQTVNSKSIYEIRIGQYVTGYVHNIQEFGIFIDFGVGKHGLLHNKEVPPTVMPTIKRNVKLNVFVISCDIKNGKARIGFENNFYNKDGSLAKNNAERVTEIVNFSKKI